MHNIVLSGCKSRPLAGYLKSLAVLRLIAEQKDAGIKGWWEADTFVVETAMTSDDLLDFFCSEYAPTPIITPWNGGSGFYPNDSKDGIQAIRQSKHPRFKIYRKAIDSVINWPEWAKELKTPGAVISGLQQVLAETGSEKKQKEIGALLKSIESAPDLPGINSILSEDIDQLETRKNEQALKNWLASIRKGVTKYSEYIRQKNKDIILPLCRSRLPDECVKWLDALCAIHDDRRLSYHQILGTGGNDGRQEFGNNFMKQIVFLLINSETEKTRELLAGALFGTPVTGSPKIKIGQFDPGHAGGYNQGMEVETKDFKANPWDYVFALEGALMMASAVVRRQSVGRSALTSPFSVRFSPVGFTSSEYTETGGTETWLPLWPQPTGHQELSHLFAEGRSSLGRKQAANGLEFSRAIGGLGVDRGISAFERYSYLKRRGDAHVALPAGKIPVKFRPGMELFSELDPITTQLDRFLKGFKNVPATLASARRRIDEAMFACTLKPEPYQFISLVRALGHMNRLTSLRDLRKTPKLTSPMFGLSPRWLKHCDDGSPEIRIAASIASIQATGRIGPLTSNLSGVSPNTPWRWDENKDQQHWVGQNVAERLANLIAYRIMDAERKSLEKIPLAAALEIHAEDAMPFLDGFCDDHKIEDLIWGLAIINWRKTGLKAIHFAWHQPATQSIMSRPWCLLKLLHTPHEIDGKKLKYETRIPRLLLANKIKEAYEAAIRRLRVSELRPYDVSYSDSHDSVRLLASLLVPIKNQDRLASLILKQKSPAHQTTGAAHA